MLILDKFQETATGLKCMTCLAEFLEGEMDKHFLVCHWECQIWFYNSEDPHGKIQQGIFCYLQLQLLAFKDEESFEKGKRKVWRRKFQTISIILKPFYEKWIKLFVIASPIWPSLTTSDLDKDQAITPTLLTRVSSRDKTLKVTVTSMVQSYL